MNRRHFLLGSAALLIGCKGKSGRSTGPTMLEWTVVGTTTDRGFFSLREFAGALVAGTYGTPRAYIWDGTSFREMSCGITSAGESVFDLREHGGALYAATESSGRLYRWSGSCWDVVFQAHAAVAGDWNNAYSIASGGGLVVSGFNEFPQNRRTLICFSPDGGAWETFVFDGVDSMHFGYADGAWYANGREQGIAHVWRSADLRRWARVASDLGSFASKIEPVGGGLAFGTEPDGAVYRIGGGRVRLVGITGAPGVQDVAEHRGSMYAVTFAGWRASSGNAAVYRVGGSPRLVAEFDEPEGWAVSSYRGDLYVGTRREGGGGKVYRGHV